MGTALMAKRMQRAIEEYKPNAPYIVSDGFAERKSPR
jgi:hypothetical protein